MPLTPDERKARQTATRRAKTAARNNLIAQAEAHGGRDLAYAVRMVKNLDTLPDWPSLLNVLASGVTGHIHCFTQPEPGDDGHGWSKHRIRFNPDGTIDMLAHPNRVVDPETELFLAGLGAPMCACVAAAIYLPARRRVPRTISGATAVNKIPRALRTAVLWAQVPDHEWTPEFGNTHLRYGITPETLAAWDAAGWDRDEALMFQQEFASLEIANAWRDDGQITTRAAALAGLGEYPNEEERWAAVGFKPSASKKWRKTNLTPAQAMEWDRKKVAPSMVEPLISADRNGWLALDVATEWTTAGIPSTEVRTWHSATNGDLEAALQWNRAKVSTYAYAQFHAWNTQHPDRYLSPTEVRQYRLVKFPENPTLMSVAMNGGVTPTVYKETLDGFARGENTRLIAALATQKPHDYNGYWPTWSTPTEQATLAQYLKRTWGNELVECLVRLLVADNRAHGRTSQ